MQTIRTMLLEGQKWRFWVKVPNLAGDSRCMVNMVSMVFGSAVGLGCRLRFIGSDHADHVQSWLNSIRKRR